MHAAQEERFTRKKHDARFPRHAVRSCLESAGIAVGDLGAVVFYDKPLLKFDRLLETYLAFAPRGIRSFGKAMGAWTGEKLFTHDVIARELRALMPEGGQAAFPELLFTEHHESHAASAFFPSPFNRAAVLCVDGVGEWATTSAWLGDGRQLTPLWEIRFPHSLGMLYSAFTYYTGFKVNAGEYKVMGLAPYGQPRYVQEIYDHLIDLKADGTFRLNLDYFDYCTGLTMTSGRFDELFGGPRRTPESMLDQRTMDLARSVQEVTEEVMLRLARTIHRDTGATDCCLAGGVALNCVANGRILREGPYERLWIQPAAGDAGGAVGAALAAWHHFYEQPREADGSSDGMSGALLGPSFPTDGIQALLAGTGAPSVRYGEDDLCRVVADELAAGKVVGWFHGPMEFGPRALGGRSILGDPRNRSMQSTMNLKIKQRESFRPFAPAVLRERVADYFDLDVDSPYMMLVASVRDDLRIPVSPDAPHAWGLDLLNQVRSTIPAVTHVDYSARVQTVDAATAPRFHKLLRAFEARTGCAVLINTSFNVRGEPIVCTPEDAYRCFMTTEMDTLVLEDCVLHKADQPAFTDPRGPEAFDLD